MWIRNDHIIDCFEGEGMLLTHSFIHSFTLGMVRKGAFTTPHTMLHSGCYGTSGEPEKTLCPM